MASPSLDVVAFALASAVLWGLSPIFAKKGFERGGTSVQAAMVAVLTTGTVAVLALSVTRGFSAFGGFTPADFGIFLAGGVVGTTLGRLSKFAGIDRVGASVSTAVTNTRPLFATLLAVGFLREAVTPLNAAGVVVLVVGVVVLSLAKGGDRRGWRSVELAFPVMAALAYGTGNVIRRYGFLESPATAVEALALNETAAFFTLGAYLFVYRREHVRSASRVPVLYFTLGGTISALGLFSLFQALSLGAVSIADPLSGMAPLFSTLFAYLLLRDVELVTRGVVVGAALIVVGGTLVTL